MTRYNFLLSLVLSFSLSAKADAGIKEWIPKFSICSMMIVTTIVAVTTATVRYRINQELVADRIFQTKSQIFAIRRKVQRLAANGKIDLSMGSELPGSVIELDDKLLQLTTLDEVDAFGRPMQLRRVLFKLSAYAPEEAFIVLSAGPDGVFETKDDIGVGAPNAKAPDHDSYNYVLEGDEWKQIRSVITF